MFHFDFDFRTFNGGVEALKELEEKFLKVEAQDEDIRHVLKYMPAVKTFYNTFEESVERLDQIIFENPFREQSKLAKVNNIILLIFSRCIISFT